MNDSIFLVNKEDYKALVERLKVEKIRTEKVEEREFTIIKIFGIDSDDCICARKTYNEGANKPEEYYIFKLPESDEWGDAIPKRKIVLETKEEVQAFFNFLSEMRKEQEKND